MTVIVEADASLVELYRSAIGGESDDVPNVDALSRHVASTPGESAVVLGASVPLDLATEFAEQMRVGRPSLGVILVRQRVDSSVLAEAMRSGVREVVESRDLTSLSDAVRRVHQVATAMRSSAGTAAEPKEAAEVNGRVITVFSSKGGVGKSTVATNLAAALTAQSQRVVAVDLDVQGGDLAIMLQLFPTRSLSDLESLRGAIDSSGVLSLLTEHSSGLSVLAAPLHLEARDNVSHDEVALTLQVLKGKFDYVVVDTSPSFDDLALTAFDHSDLLVLVGTLDIPALKNLKMAAGTLDLLNIPRNRWRLVLNRADSKVGLAPAEFEKTLGLSITASLPSSREVLAAVNRGEAIVNSDPKHPVSTAITALALDIIKESADRGTDTVSAPGRRSRFGLRRVSK
ncbi:MAG: AAA family ATPase [Nocardioides sp.]